MRLRAIIHEFFYQERDNFLVWLPIWFGLGAVIYFSLPNEPSLGFIYFIVVLYVCTITILFFKYKNYLVLFCISLIIAGFTASYVRTNALYAPVLNTKLSADIIAIIKNIETTDKGTRLLLENIIIKNMDRQKTPKYIRITTNKDIITVKIGDKIQLKAIIYPPPPPVIPGSYDFTKFAYFKQIGATGFAISDISLIEPANNNNIKTKIDNLRHEVSTTILAHLPEEQASIATALLIGQRAAIKKELLENVQNAGLAHLLAISGMHLAMVAAFFFFLSRGIIAFFEYPSLHFNSKKIAAFLAIAGSFAYLLLSGAPISAQRAFIMTFLVLLAILIDRTATPLRSIALAALIILIISPESILFPGFQMSFAAAAALIVFFEQYGGVLLHREKHKISVAKKALLYLGGILLSSVIAGLATTPFALYHFNNMAVFGVVANLIAIPITTFIIMPAGIMALVVMPLGIDTLFLYIMGFGIKILIHIAEFIASLPGASKNIGILPDIVLLLLVIPLIIMIALKNRLRKLSLALILPAFLVSAVHKRPDIIIEAREKTFLIRNEEGDLFAWRDISSSFTKDVLVKALAADNNIFIDHNYNNNESSILTNLNCDFMGCTYKKNNHLVAFSLHQNAIADDCRRADVIVNFTHIFPPCYNNKVTINRWDLYKKGSFTIQLDKKIKVSHAKKVNPARPWE